MVVSISTVGFGDISPKSSYGWLCVILTIIAVLSIMPHRIDKFSTF